MRHFTTLFAILFLSFFGNSQDCDSLMTVSTDKFTKEVMKTLIKPITDYSNEDHKNAIISFVQSSKVGVLLVITIVTEDNCVKSQSKCTFLFEDGSTSDQENFNDFNCEGNYHFPLYRDKKTALFFTKKIVAIRFVTQKGKYDHELSDVNAEKLLSALKCAY